MPCVSSSYFSDRPGNVQRIQCSLSTVSQLLECHFELCPTLEGSWRALRCRHLGSLFNVHRAPRRNSNFDDFASKDFASFFSLMPIKSTLHHFDHQAICRELVEYLVTLFSLMPSPCIRRIMRVVLYFVNMEERVNLNKGSILKENVLCDELGMSQKLFQTQHSITVVICFYENILYHLLNRSL